MPEWLTIKAPYKPRYDVPFRPGPQTLEPKLRVSGVEADMRRTSPAENVSIDSDKPVRAKAPPKQREQPRQRPPLDPEKPYSQGYERAVWGKDTDGKKAIVGWEKITDEEAYS